MKTYLAAFKPKPNLSMKKYLAMLIAVGFLFSCEENIQEVSQEISEIDLSQGELAFTDKSGETVEAYYKGELVTLQVIDGTYVLGGDMIIPESQILFVEPPEAEFLKTESVGRTAGRWPNNTVYYTVNSNLPNQSRVTDAIAEWESKTNLTFVQRTNQSDYIEFRSGSGCSSSVGRVGGRQYINLASGCSTGNNIHEIGHAIGLYHEHTRGDRDTYVTVNFGNIQSGREYNFYTYIQRGTDGQDYTSTLDFGSIMMYSSYAFSNNGQPTITKKDGSTFTTQRNALSSDDLDGINQMYPSGGGGGGPVYNNGQWYTIDGLRVYRYNNKWYYYTSTYGWREVVNINGRWYYA